MFRAGWEWVAIEGTTTLIGPADRHPEVAAGDVPALLREIFTDAGGTHDDWDEYDRAMSEQRRAIVFVDADRVYSNG